MVKIIVRMSDEENKRIGHLRIENSLRSKEETILKIINKFEGEEL